MKILRVKSKDSGNSESQELKGSESSESQEVKGSESSGSQGVESSQTSNWSETSDALIDKENTERLIKEEKLRRILEELKITYPSQSLIDLTSSPRQLKLQARAVHTIFMEVLDLLVFKSENLLKVFTAKFL